jgi:hypothetical protein
MRAGFATGFVTGLALAFLIGTALPTLAGEGFDIVIPGRPGVPVIINGVDASYAVVEGEWGLGRGPHMQPTVYGGRPVEPEPQVGHYYPTLGRTPGYGRLEIEPPPNRILPKPAESYHESWTSQSAPPARTQPEVPLYPPQVIVAPPMGMPQQAPGQMPPGQPPNPRPRGPGPLPNRP